MVNMEVFFTLVVSSLFIASVSLVQTLGLRCCHMVNLAGGLLVILGGICASIIVGSIDTGRVVGRDLLGLIALVLVAAWLIYLRRSVRVFMEQPPLYALGTLGLLAVLHGASELFWPGGQLIYADRLPASSQARICYSICGFGLSLLAFWFFSDRTRIGAELVLAAARRGGRGRTEFLIEKLGVGPERIIWRTLAAEAFVLMSVGAVFSFYHRGVLGQSEQITAVGILIAVAANGSLLWITVLACLSAAGQVAVGPVISGKIVTANACGVVIPLLAALLGEALRRRNMLDVFNAESAEVPLDLKRWQRIGSMSFALDWPGFLAGVAMAAFIAQGIFSPTASIGMLKLIMLAWVACLAEYFAGVSSVLWLPLSTCAGYAFAVSVASTHGGLSTGEGVLIALLSCLAISLLLPALRRLSKLWQLLIGLAGMVLLREVFRGIDGADAIIVVSPDVESRWTLPDWGVSILFLLCATFVVILFHVMRTNVNIRLLAVGFRYPRFGSRFGYVNRIRALAAPIPFGFLAGVCGFVSCRMAGTINSLSAELWDGLLVFVCGFMAARTTLAAPIIVFVLQSFLVSVFSDPPVVRMVLTGILLGYVVHMLKVQSS